MSLTINHHQAVVLDRSAKPPRFVIEIKNEQVPAVQDLLSTLSQIDNGVSAQTILLDALRTAVEQSYFWTPEWQAKERAADQAIAEGRVRTFDRMEDMLDFLDAQ